MSDYLEIAQGTPRNRGVLIAKDTLAQYINAKEPLYRSMYLYDEQAVTVAQRDGSIKKYSGLRGIDKILIDIDKGGNSDEHTLNFLRGIIFELDELNLPQCAMQTFFSGSGYHLAITNESFNFPRGTDLPLIVKSTIQKLIPDVDISVYSRTGIYRVAHTINKKTGLYKIPLTFKEVSELTAREIKQLAETQRLDYPYQTLLGDSELEEYIVTNPSITTDFGTVAEPTKVVPCIQGLLRQGPISGSRHNVSLRIISHLRRNGIPSEFAKALMLHWNKNSMDPQEIVELVESSYNGNYQYSCNDPTLAANCQTRCVYFKRKDYAVQVKNATDMQSDYHERMTTDFGGRMIDLGLMLGLKDVDCTLLPGELVTIFGATGSNKTTLAQNIALGVDFAKDRIVKEWQVPTLFLSLELSAWYMHRRHMQIVSGLDKVQVNANYADLFEEYHECLDHIVVQTISPTIDQILRKIRALQPSLVVIDYIDLVETPHGYKGEYEKIKYISHNLSNMAVNLDVMILQISQVSREYSRNDVLDLYAGKGSGAIENASRKVIGLHGQSAVPKKSLEMFKNTDGELFKVDLEWRPNFRMKRIPTEDI